MPDAIRSAVVEQYEGLIASQLAVHGVRVSGRTEEAGAEQEPAVELARWMRHATVAERDFVLDQRRRGRVTPETADEALREIESRSLRASR